MLVREGYHKLLDKNTDRMIGIDAGQSIEAVHVCILRGLKENGIID